MASNTPTTLAGSLCPAAAATSAGWRMEATCHRGTDARLRARGPALQGSSARFPWKTLWSPNLAQLSAVHETVIVISASPRSYWPGSPDAGRL